MTDSSIDPAVLRQQYSDATHLTARQALWQFRTGPSLYETALDRAHLTGAEVVVDVGCGNGNYLAELRRRGHTGALLGLDRSEGMARTSLRHAPTAVADAQALPLRDGEVDLALCMHMLYHVPDAARAVAELRRVVRPAGRVLVATNGPGHTTEARAVLAQAARTAAGLDLDRGVDLDRFAFRFGPQVARDSLAAVFDSVTVEEVGGAFDIPDPAVLRGYLASWPPESIGLSAGPVWAAILAEADRLIAAHFATHPSFTITSQASLLIAG